MDLFLDFPLTTLFGVGVALWVTTAIFRRRRGDRPGEPGPRATCGGCGAAVPPVARYCRQCGRGVSP